MTSNNLKKQLAGFADKEKARILQGFFKTGPGQYGEGDIFIGVKVPDVRRVAKMFPDISDKELEKLLTSKIHEERLCALIILVLRFEKSDEEGRKKIFDYYLAHTKWINNWDLVDLSSHEIVGTFLLDKDWSLLKKLAKSKSLWERRIAMVSTYAFIREKKGKGPVLEIARILLNDTHDLIHKAVGWMLREQGKRDFDSELGFLKKHYADMPRTMLRYAIEKFPEDLRQDFLKGRV